MGTSNSYNGPGGNTPLVPSWLGGDTGSPPTSPDTEQSDNGETDKDATNPQQPSNDTAATVPAGRFQNARTNFTRFVNSGGSDRKALGRSVSNYISHSLGGSRNAAKRIGSSKRTTAGLISFLNSVRTEGVEQALSTRSLDELIGRPIDEIFIGLADVICPDGGNIDEGIARSAFIETIADVVEQGIDSLDNLTSAQFQTVVESFITNVIESRLCNDIGTKIIFNPANIEMVNDIQAQLHDYIGRSVSDALSRHSSTFENLGSNDSARLIDQVYLDSFSILQSISESESN